MSYTKINSIEHLKELSIGEELECFMSLAGGAVRSSKRIQWDVEDKVFQIENEIDDTSQVLTEKELHTESNIGMAIERGAFYKY